MPDLHCVQNSASYSLYSGRYDPSMLGFQPLPRFIPKHDTWENCYISSYEGLNEIYKYVPERAWNLISMVQVSYLEDEIVTCGIPYNFAILNIPVTGHLGKIIISPNW